MPIEGGRKSKTDWSSGCAVFGCVAAAALLIGFFALMAFVGNLPRLS